MEEKIMERLLANHMMYPKVIDAIINTVWFKEELESFIKTILDLKKEVEKSE